MDKLQHVLNVVAHVVTGTWMVDTYLSIRPGSDTAQRTLLARRPPPVVLQAGSVSSSVSERPRTTVPVELLRLGRQCCHSTASAFRQPSATCSTSLPSQHLRPPCLFSRRPAPPSETLSWISSGTRPSVQSVSDVCLKRICLLDTSAFSALEVLDDYCTI